MEGMDRTWEVIRTGEGTGINCLPVCLLGGNSIPREEIDKSAHCNKQCNDEHEAFKNKTKHILAFWVGFCLRILFLLYIHTLHCMAGSRRSLIKTTAGDEWK